jgi:tetratricopeptide (TPR) repeat protein
VDHCRYAATVAGDLHGFRLQYPLAEGGAGVVWRGVHRASRASVAVKTLAPGPAAGALWEEEARRAAQVGPTAGWARLLHWGRTVSATSSLPANTHFLVMELGDATLAERPPSTEDALRAVLADLLDALSNAHARGILHLDVTPSNLLWANERVLLTDLGTSAAYSCGKYGGTPGFAAPEQHSRGLLDRRTDVFGVGRTALALLDAGGIASASLRQWAERACAAAPHDRWSSAHGARTALGSSGSTLPLAPTIANMAPLSSVHLLAEPPWHDPQGAREALLTELEMQGCVLRWGPPGVGCSRLAREAAVALAVRTGARSLFVTLGAETNPYVELVRCLLGGSDRARERVEALVGDAPEHEVEAMVQLAEDSAARPAKARARRLLRAALIRAAPILCVDDVDAHLDVVEFLREVASEGRVRVVFTARAPLEGFPGSAVSSRADEELDGMLKKLAVGPVVRATLVNRCGGNPGFTVSLLRDAVRRDLLVEGPQGLRWRDDVVPDIPRSLLAVHQARVEQLTAGRSLDEVRPILGAAHLGMTVAREVVERAFGGLSDEMPAALLEYGIAEISGNKLRFRSGEAREALRRYAALAGLTQQLERVCAEVAPTSEARAMHLLRGGCPRQALAPLRDAVRERLRNSELLQGRALILQHQQAEEDAGLPEEDSNREERLIQSLQVAFRTSLTDMRAVVDQAEQTAKDRGWREAEAAALRVRSSMMRATGDADGAQRVLRQALARTQAPRMTAMLQWDLAISIQASGNWDGCGHWMERAVESARAGGQDMYATFRAQYAAFLVHRGSEEGDTLTRAVLEDAKAFPLGIQTQTALSGRAVWAHATGRYEEAHALYAEALEVRRINAPRFATLGELNLVMVELEVGDAEAAHQRLSRVLSDPVLRKRWWETTLGLRLAVAAGRGDWPVFEAGMEDLKPLSDFGSAWGAARMFRLAQGWAEAAGRDDDARRIDAVASDAEAAILGRRDSAESRRASVHVEGDV